MTDPYRASPRDVDPITTAAAMLLHTGRTTMAFTLLEHLSDVVRAAVAAAKPLPPFPSTLQLEAAPQLTRLRSQARELVAEIARPRDERRQAEVATRRREMAGLDAAIARKRHVLEQAGTGRSHQPPDCVGPSRIRCRPRRFWVGSTWTGPRGAPCYGGQGMSVTVDGGSGGRSVRWGGRPDAGSSRTGVLLRRRRDAGGDGARTCLASGLPEFHTHPPSGPEAHDEAQVSRQERQ